MPNCPYCGALEVPDNFPSASQRFSVYNYTCGTEIVFCGSSEGLVEWKCTDGFRVPKPDPKAWLENMSEDQLKVFQDIMDRIRRMK